MTDPISPNPRIRVCLRGVAHLLIASGERIVLERKLAWLLAYLWIEGPTARAKLAGMLWPEVSQERARATLRQRLSMLRKAAGAELVVDATGALALAPSLSIEEPSGLDAVLLDTFGFDDNEACSAWLEDQRNAQRAQQRTRLLADVRQALREGLLDDALQRADRLLGLDRESEEAYRIQMEVLYLRGDNAAAIAAWDRCKLMLRQLYGVAPSAATRRLGETILGAAQGAPQATLPDHDVPLSVLRPPRLVARAPLVHRMLAGWREGRPVRVSGEAGLGKSRLLAEFAAQAGPCTVVSARPGDMRTPYASLGRLLLAGIDRFDPPLDPDDAAQAARLLPGLAAVVGGPAPAAIQTDHERQQCLLAAGRLLGESAARGCCAFVLDDLHFADRASVEAVVEMAAGSASAEPSLTPTPIRWIFAARDEDLDERNAALLSSLGERSLCIALQPLGESEVGELVQSLELPGRQPPNLAQRLWRHVGGNPAFLLESIKLLLSLGESADSLPLPPSQLAVVERRIGLLSPPARHLAQLAAISGDAYSVPLAAAALGCVPLALSEPMRELERSQILYGRRFVHDVIATAVERMIARAVADYIHQFVAGYLQQHGGEPAQLAHHWSACGEYRQAGLAYVEAAQRAAAASRPVEQCELLDAAAACFERCGANDDLFDALTLRHNVSAAPDRATTHRARLERLEALAQTEEQHLRALLCRQGSDAEQGRDETVGVGLAAIERALALGKPSIACEFARSVAWRQAFAGDEAAAQATLEAQRAWVMTGATPVERAEFHGAHAAVLAYCDRLQAAIAVGQLALAELRAQGNWLPMLPLLSNLGVMLTWRGELDAAKAVLLEAAALRDRMHGRGSALLIDMNLGVVLLDQGDYLAAEPLLTSTVAEMRRRAPSGEPDIDLALGEQRLAQLWLALGLPGRALETMTSPDTGLAPRIQARRLTLTLRAQRMRDGAADSGLVERVRSLVAQQTSPFYRALIELELAAIAPPAQSLPVCARLLTEPTARERPGLLLHAAARAAQAELALGRPDAALPYLEQVRALEPHHAPYDIDRAEAWLIEHDVLRATGQEAEAARLLQRAAAWLTDTAASRVAPAWRRAFSSGHPTNARLLRLAGG